VSKRRYDLDQDVDEEMDELADRFRFRNPNDKKRNRLSKDSALSKTKRNRHRYDETGYDDS
jgi:hypothetical protein